MKKITKKSNKKIWDKNNKQYKQIKINKQTLIKPYKCVECGLGMMQLTRNEVLEIPYQGQIISIKNAPVHICDICERMEYDELVKKTIANLCHKARAQGLDHIEYVENRIYK